MIPKCVYFRKGQIKCFSLTRLHQHYCGYWNHAFFLCVIIWHYANISTLWRRHVFEWTVLGGRGRVLTLIRISLWFWDFSLCNFRDLIYARSACNTPKRNQNLKSHHMTSNKQITLTSNVWTAVEHNLITLQLTFLQNGRPFVKINGWSWLLYSLTVWSELWFIVI